MYQLHIQQVGWCVLREKVVEGEALNRIKRDRRERVLNVLKQIMMFLFEEADKNRYGGHFHCCRLQRMQ
jgi:protein-tyrosine phosphatase